MRLTVAGTTARPGRRGLLAETRLTSDGVAERVDYDSAASLSRVLRDVTGTSPRAFRRAGRGQTAD